ncbi:protein of unknown function [Methylacidimicrobium sp. AP8]|nr:protein of unknown function [Methylacidimicrobium sp. AP8]
MLGLVGMFRSSVDVKLPKYPSPQTVVRDHALHGVLDQKFRLPLPDPLNRLGVMATDKPGVPHEGLRPLLLAGEDRPRRIDDHDVVAGIDMGGILGLMLTAEQDGRLHGHPAYRLPRRIDYIPRAPNIGGFCTEGFHGKGKLREWSMPCQGQARPHFSKVRPRPRPAAGLLIKPSFCLQE